MIVYLVVLLEVVCDNSFSSGSKCLWTGGLPLRGVTAFWIVGQLLQAGSTMVSSQAEPSAPVCGRYWVLPDLGSNN